MSERSTALIVGLLAMLIGIGMFLWDWYGEYIHFVWFIPFFILGPMIFIFGLVAVIKALLPTKKGFKEITLPKESKEKVSRYYNDKYGFSIEPPNGWTMVKGLFDKPRAEPEKALFKYLKKTTEATFVGPRGEYPNRPSMTITVEDNKQNWTLDEWASGFKQFCTKNFASFQLLSENRRVIDSIDAYEETHFSKIMYDDRLLHQKQVVLLKDVKVYEIIYSAYPTNYNKYLHAFEASVETLKFKPKPN